MRATKTPGPGTRSSSSSTEPVSRARGVARHDLAALAQRVHEDLVIHRTGRVFDHTRGTQTRDLAKERGRPVLAEKQALDAVAELLSAADWSSDHLNAVADMVRATGRTIEDVQC